MNAVTPIENTKPVGRVLTGPGGEFEVPEAIRDMLAFCDDDRLFIVTGRHLDLHVLTFIEDLKRAGRRPKKETCSLTQIRELYANSAAHGDAVSIQSGPSAVNDSKMQRRVLQILAHACKEGASDVHLIRRDEVCRIRMRVHGLLEDYAPMPEVPAELGLEMASAIYQGMCDVGEETFNARKPQDGRLGEEFVRQIGLYGARVATRPLDRGQLLVARLLHMSANANPTLEGLGYLPPQVADIGPMTQNKTGVHLFAGATGSGKSTSLQVLISRLAHFFKNQLNVITLEDPPEYPIDGALQTPVINGDWEGGVRNLMRLDPDVIMVGEVRDLPTAVAATRAGLTGHGVWTTVHANGPFATLQRLIDLGLDPALVCDAALIRGLVYQSLVPILCDECKRPYRDAQEALDPSFKRRLHAHCPDAQIYFRNEAGCSKCRFGHKGRSVAAEVLSTNQDVLDIQRTQGKTAARRSWVHELDGLTKSMHLATLIMRGQVDPMLGEAIGGRLDLDGGPFLDRYAKMGEAA